jgi:hypothetical protein
MAKPKLFKVVGGSVIFLFLSQFRSVWKPVVYVLLSMPLAEFE